MARVAVIGAGASGLAAIKTCLEEGLKPICYEKTPHIGGVWYYSDDDPRSDPRGSGAIYHDLHTNIPKEFMAYSDFPHPKTSPPFLKGCDMQAYYEHYADCFDLRKHIEFNIEVVSVDKANDYDNTGRWKVTVRPTSSEELRSEIVDSVMVCSGIYPTGLLPEYPGLDSFKGEVMHSCQVKRGSYFTDKTVLIVGSGTSGGDIANMISHHASQVYLSLRRGAWCIPRFFYNDLTVVEFINQRWKRWLPSKLIERWIQKKVEDKTNNEIIGIQSFRPLFGVHMMTDEELPTSIMEGRVRVRSGIERFDGSGVHFVDGSVVEDVDYVIFATGYELKVPFFHNEVIADGYEHMELYKHMFPLHHPHPTLSFVGFSLPSTTGQNIASEMQARYITKVIKGEIKLPSFRHMQDEITSRKKSLFDQFEGYFPFITNPLAYYDGLAKEIGALPNLIKLIFTDPVLAYYFYFTPSYPPCYRLVGPGAVPWARQALIDSRENQMHAITVKTVRKDARQRLKEYKDSQRSFIPIFVIIGAVLFSFLYLCVF